MSRRSFMRSVAVGGASVAAAAWPTVGLAQSRASVPVAPTSKYIEVGGIRLHYLEWGRPDGRPSLLLLHPAPLNARVWVPFATAMAGQYHIVAPDARGFGDSQWSPSYDDDVFLRDVHAVVTELRLTRLTLCGNSMGATLAYAYASASPAAVERLIVVDTGPGERAASGDPTVASQPAPAAASGQAGAPRGGPPRIRIGPFDSREAAAAAVPVVLGPAFTDAMLASNLRTDGTGRYHWKFDPAVLTAGERSMRDPRKWTWWLGVRCPTLVLRGARSPALTPRAAEQMVAAHPRATLVTVPDAGHFIPLEQPAAFEAAVRGWLSATH